MIEDAFTLASQKKYNSALSAFYPTRVLMQDFTGVPAVADLAAMRNALKKEDFSQKSSIPYQE